MGDLPNPVMWAIPFFLASLAVECLYLRKRSQYLGYEFKDSRTSISMGLGNLAIMLAAAPITVGVSQYVYDHWRIFTFEMSWSHYLLLFLAEDFLYYWFHRISHERRVWWAAHVNHHSSEFYNLSTALRQTWTGFISLTWLLWLPLSFLGFPTKWVVFQKGISLVYQYWIHTEAIHKFPRPFEWIMNTPSHHRVHHATNPAYLDKNYAGILIIWDRLFGTFQDELSNEKIKYGITENLKTYNLFQVAFHEWLAIFAKMKVARNFGAKIKILFDSPSATKK